MYLEQEDPEVSMLVKKEEQRQSRGLELIPSENYVSRAVREASASVFTNKYSEGYPGRRYYGGQEHTDALEVIAIERARSLFGAAYANVQPLSGAAANVALYMALLEPGDTVLGMDLSHGGHLTHGHPVTYLSKVFRFVRYGMKDVATGAIDYDELEVIARREKPKILLAGFSSYPRTLDYARMCAIARSVGAVAVMDAAHIAGLIAGKALPNPFDFGFDVMTTTTHKTLRGPRGGVLLTREDASIAKKIDAAVFPGLQGGPHMQQVAAKAVCFKEASTMAFQTYAAQVLKNAKAMERVFVDNGVVLVTGGTDNHLLLIDTVASFGCGGAEAEAVLDSVGMTVNKNVLPNDTRKPLDPSGVRLGTPALTSRGMGESESADIARFVVAALRSRADGDALVVVRGKVEALCQAFPVPDTFTV